MICRIALALIGLALVATTATACDWGDDSDGSGYYSTLCVDPSTQYRVAYSQCSVHPGWVYYVHDGYNAPRVGSKVSKYNKSAYKTPSNATVKTNGVKTQGGSVPKITKGPGVKVYNPPKQNTNKGNNGGGYKPKPVVPKVKVGK